MRSPVAVLSATVALAACSGSDRSGWSPDQAIPVSSVGAPVAVSGIAQPVAVSGVGQPVAVSGVAQPVAVAGVAEPVAISSVAAPVRLVRPELDPDRIESGNGASGRAASCALFCSELVSGPFILTDLVVGEGAVTVRVGGNPGLPRWTGYFPAKATVTGARFAVRSGETLVIETGGFLEHVTWSGFRP